MTRTFPAGEQRQVLELSGQAGAWANALSTPRKLEIRTHQAKVAGSKQATAVAIVCHPHPLFGGSMDNKVVHTLCRAYRDLGIHAVRFNFRGVGQSEGEYGRGEGEQDDLALVVDWVRGLEPDLPIYIAGFSFGAYVAASYIIHQVAREYVEGSEQVLTHAEHIPVEHLILVAPPVNHFDFDKLRLFPCPTVIIQGLDDEVVPADEVISWSKSVKVKPPEADDKMVKTKPAQLLTLEQTSHFFHGKLSELKTSVATALNNI